MDTPTMQQQNRLNMKHDNLLNIVWFDIWQNVIHIQCWQVHDDALLRSKGTNVDIGHSAGETKPDWCLMRHDHLTCHNCICNYFVSFKKSWWKSSNCNSQMVKSEIWQKEIPLTATARHDRVSQRGRRRHQELSCHTSRCMLVYCSDTLHTKGIWDMLQEKQALTGPWSAAESHQRMEYPIHFLFAKKVSWKPLTCNNRIVSTWIMTTCWMLDDLISCKNVIHIQCWQVHDDALLRAGEQLWILHMLPEKRSQTGPGWGTTSYMS